MDDIPTDFSQTPRDNIEMFSSSKVEFSKPLLVMEALRVCFKIRAQEMRKGFIQEKFDKFGNVLREVIPDSRKQFISSVKALRGLLSPETTADKIYMEKEKALIQKLKEAFDKYSYKPFSMKVVVDENDVFKNKKRIPYIPEGTLGYIPEAGSTIELLSKGVGNSVLISRKGGWDIKTDAYTDECLIVYDEIFEELNQMVGRTNYFKKKKQREKKGEIDGRI